MESTDLSIIDLASTKQVVCLIDSEDSQVFISGNMVAIPNPSLREMRHSVLTSDVSKSKMSLLTSDLVSKCNSKDNCTFD